MIHGRLVQKLINSYFCAIDQPIEVTHQLWDSFAGVFDLPQPSVMQMQQGISVQLKEGPFRNIVQVAKGLELVAASDHFVIVLRHLMIVQVEEDHQVVRDVDARDGQQPHFALILARGSHSRPVLRMILDQVDEGEEAEDAAATEVSSRVLRLEADFFPVVVDHRMIRLVLVAWDLIHLERLLIQPLE